MPAALARPKAPAGSAISYRLTPRPVAGGGYEIVLDLFRGGVPALTRTIVRVRAPELAPVVLACRRYLERRGASAALPAATKPERATASVTPVAAFDWMFAS